MPRPICSVPTVAARAGSTGNPGAAALIRRVRGALRRRNAYSQRQGHRLWARQSAGTTIREHTMNRMILRQGLLAVTLLGAAGAAPAQTNSGDPPAAPAEPQAAAASPAGQVVNGQVDRQADRVTQDVQNRAQNKVDNTVDTAVDKVLGKVFGN